VSGGPPPLEGARLEVLLKAYELERTDDIQAATTMLTFLTTALGLASLIGFVLLNDSSLPGWVVALSPLPPIPFIAFGALYAHLAQVRGALIDRYEVELRRRFPGLEADRLPVPSGHSILGHIWVTAFGRTVVFLSAIVFLALYIGVIIESFRVAHNTEPTLALCSLAASIVATAITVLLFIVALFPMRVVDRELARLTRHLSE
jgi:hypothetical protein